MVFCVDKRKNGKIDNLVDRLIYVLYNILKSKILLYMGSVNKHQRTNKSKTGGGPKKNHLDKKSKPTFAKIQNDFIIESKRKK